MSSRDEGGPLSTFRANWRVFALLVLLVGSAVALFGPADLAGADDGETARSGPTNLEYGIQLDGGTRIRAPIVGMTAENVDVTGSNAAEVERAVSDALGVEPIDVQARPGASGSGTVEVFVEDVSRDEFRIALQEAGVSTDDTDVREGVTAATREQMVRVVERKISEAGLSGGSVRQISTATGDHFIVIEAPNRDAGELRDLLSERGAVRVVAHYPQNGSYVNETVLQQGDFSSIGVASYDEQTGHHVPVTVRDGVAGNFARTMVEAGYGQGTQCYFQGYGNASGRCLLIVSDDEVVNSFGVRSDLGQSFANGDFENDPGFIMTVPNRSEAQTLAINLRAGRLPAPLDFDRGTTFSLEPALAERFKVNSLLTGLVAVLAVSVTVFFRYGDVRVAAPMVLTALSEVALLLGFAAAIGYPLDLAVIAGFIAVIGTGVDDLIIIADEVLSEGDVSSTRVFRSRFRRAFWVIGAAAATTIIAMTPLAGPWFSLGDLQGFAIVTIVGVLVGVLITRPAYGDILRTLLTER